ncbi:unnamed protein product [Adineta steineri]|uniref:Uncharacterized protein n=1 Tax=Adineta steineri TaxID=433720 RepID=A0A815L639_9BILA|nr:unnamed protein product [Adineta steineri]CAF3508990.1 unnamed protein product [Adineta steineri]
MAANSGHTAAVIAYEESGQPVKIVYDTWTPRPHFIIKQYQPKEDVSNSELQATFDIINHFLHKNSQFDTQAILAFHRGTWYKQHTSEWHAHLCVSQEEYLKEAKIQITESPKTREWSGAKTVEEGMKNWYTKQMKNYANYKNDCIQKKIPNQTVVQKIALSMFSSSEFKLVWLSSSPRIGIVAQSPSTSNMMSLYTYMEKTRVDAEKELSQKQAKFKNFGCHLCLYVHGQSGTFVTCRQDQILNENGRIDDITNIVGYIQMDESQYLEWLPHNLRQVWLNEFGRAEHFVRT